MAEYYVNLNLTHSQTIMPMCEHVLSGCGLRAGDMDAFAVTNGPGSFTGLRIGTAAAKGMAYAVSAPCIAVSTLDALAENASGFAGIICAVMDARCNQVYNALYRQSGGIREKLCADRALKIETLFEELSGYREPVLLVGDGAELCRQKWQEQGTARQPDILLADPKIRHQRASSAAVLAMQRMRDGQGLISASELMPEYLRLPQAERERLQKQGGFQKRKRDRANVVICRGDLPAAQKEERKDRSMIAIGCDHSGVSFKMQLIKYLEEKGMEYRDFGTYSEVSCDYPDIAKPVCESILNGTCEKGILICGTGIGISMAANKIHGIRAALCHDYFSAKYTRLHNDSNIIAFGARVIGTGLATELLDIFLNTEFEGNQHTRRIQKMMDLEKQN